MRVCSRLTAVLLLTASAAFAPSGSQAQSGQIDQSGQIGDYSHYVSPWKTPWDYQGPRGARHWSALDPEYAICNTGKQQSPIDIRSPRKAHLPPLRFEYRDEPVRYVVNNGHTIRVNYHDTPGSGSFLLIGRKRYQLIQFHFHHPSEERINGKAYDMVLHLMHKADDGEIVGVAVLVKAGRANPTVQRVFDHMPVAEGQLPVPGLDLDPAGMLPRDTAYYAYTGSVTAPPCTEGVHWIVLKTPIEMSAAQIRSFAGLFPDDARPTQPLNGRAVEGSE